MRREGEMAPRQAASGRYKLVESGHMEEDTRLQNPAIWEPSKVSERENVFRDFPQVLHPGYFQSPPIDQTSGEFSYIF